MENKTELLIKMLTAFMTSDCYPIDFNDDEAIDVAEHVLSEINEFKYGDDVSPYSSIQEILCSYMIPKTFATLFTD